MNINKPIVSIIMPAYNAEKYIQESIESVLNQSFKHIELIIVNDGSTDTTPEIISSFCNKDARVIALENKGKGVSSARNFGIRHAKGNFISFIDADDVYGTDSVLKRVDWLLNHPKSDVVFCITSITDQDLNELGWMITGKPIITFVDFYVNPVHTNAVMIRADIVKRLEFDKQFSSGEDWLFFQRIARMGIKFYRVDGCKVYYRQHQATVLHNFLKHENHLLQVLDIVYGEDIDCPEPLAKFRKGLNSPQKELIVLIRRIRLFNFLLLNHDFDNAEIVGHEIASSVPDYWGITQAYFSFLFPYIFLVKSESYFTDDR